MKHITSSSNYTIVIPESLEEAGLMQWLSERYKGQSIKLLFDTTTINNKERFPALWIEL